MSSEKNNIETEYLEHNTKQEWPLIYQKIRSESSKTSNQCTEAIKPQNKILNRYRDVSPFDHSRIKLGRGSSDYINANLIVVQKANRKYILTQGPLPNTIGHFWLMVWEQKSKAVLMLNKLLENKQEKCSQYWPAKMGKEHLMTFEDVGLTLEYVEFKDHSYYLTRLLRLTDISNSASSGAENSRDIIQFHYTTWPDFGVPTSPTAFLEFLKKVRQAGVLEEDVGPAVVHCSAGIGRSGTFCLVDSCLVLIKNEGLNSVDVKEVLLEMRTYRMGLIQTPEQLRFSYQAIIEGAKQLLSSSCEDKENCNSDIVITNKYFENNGGNSSDAEEEEEDEEEEEEEPPPLPPPRLDSLRRECNGPPAKPLPVIPSSASLTDFTYESDNSADELHSPPSLGPLPVVPARDEDEEEELLEGSSEDELEEEDSDEEDLESPMSEKYEEILKDISPAAELRHRKRVERNEQMAAKVREIKRRQQINEQWTQLKRSLYTPLVISGAIAIGGGLVAYFYFRT